MTPAFEIAERGVVITHQRGLGPLEGRRLRRLPPELRAAWNAHLEHDEYLSCNELRSAATVELPEHHLEPHLFWRYALSWRAPGP